MSFKSPYINSRHKHKNNRELVDVGYSQSPQASPKITTKPHKTESNNLPRTSSFFGRFRQTLTTIIIGVIVLGVSVYLYRVYQRVSKMKSKMNVGFIDKNIYRPDYDYYYVIYFSSKNCPHCDKIKPVWDQLLRNFPQDDTGIIFKHVIYEEQPDAVKYFKIDAFPAIVGVRHGKIQTTFGGPRNYDNLFRFVIMFIANH